jgi:hypothetical protein
MLNIVNNIKSFGSFIVGFISLIIFINGKNALLFLKCIFLITSTKAKDN